PCWPRSPSPESRTARHPPRLRSPRIREPGLARQGYPQPTVRSDSNSVDGYLAEVPEERRDALTRLRGLCREELRGFDEVMAYGMPAYERDGAAEIAFASQKRYISFYLMRSDVREAFAAQLAGQNIGKGCLRFRGAESVDFDLLRELLRATAAASGE